MLSLQEARCFKVLSGHSTNPVDYLGKYYETRYLQFVLKQDCVFMSLTYGIFCSFVRNIVYTGSNWLIHACMHVQRTNDTRRQHA